MMLRKAKVHALDRLLWERFGGKGVGGVAVEGSRRCETPRHLESLFAPVLTVCSQGSENRSATGHNAG
jgi:hypothetical protein